MEAQLSDLKAQLLRTLRELKDQGPIGWLVIQNALEIIKKD